MQLLKILVNNEIQYYMQQLRIVSLQTLKLLEALEKSKPDHSLLVWDVFAKTVTETTSERRLAATHPEPFPIKPLVELGQFTVLPPGEKVVYKK